MQSCTPIVFPEYISFPSEFRNDVEIFKIVQPVIELSHRKWRKCGWFFGENLTNLVTIESKGVNHLWKQIQRCWCICFWGCRSHRCWQQHRRPMHNSMRVQPEIKMADGKPEAFKPDIGDGIYVNFNGICISFASNNITGRMLVGLQDDVRVVEN